MKAAFTLSPIWRPSQMPAPMAMMFLSVPPSSTPTISVLVYTRKTDELRIDCAFFAASSSGEAMTVDESLPRMISRARFGPDRAQIGGCFDAPNSCLMTSLIRVPVSISRPFTALTMTVSWSMNSATFLMFSLRVLEGTAKMVRSAPPRASVGSCVTRIAG